MEASKVGRAEVVERLAELREKSASHSVLKAAAFTIAAFDAMPALLGIVEAARAVVEIDGALDYDPDNELTTAQRVTLDMRLTESMMALSERVAALTSGDSGALPDSPVAACPPPERS